MNLIERLLAAVTEPSSSLTQNDIDDVGVVENYFRTTATSRGWSLNEFCSWVEENFSDRILDASTRVY